MRREVASQVVNTLKDGQFVFSYYPDKAWLRSSAYLNCKPDQIARLATRQKQSDG